MFRHSVRGFATTASRAAELATRIDNANQYGVQLAKVQQHVNGFVGGREALRIVSTVTYIEDCQQLLVTRHSSA